jgi:hypothetical protein
MCNTVNAIYVVVVLDKENGPYVYSDFDDVASAIDCASEAMVETWYKAIVRRVCLE